MVTEYFFAPPKSRNSVLNIQYFTGIWGDTEAFTDNCNFEGNFNATKHCNKKIIGAR